MMNKRMLWVIELRLLNLAGRLEWTSTLSAFYTRSEARAVLRGIPGARRIRKYVPAK